MATRLRKAIVGVLYIIEDALAAMMIPGSDDDKPCGDTCLATMMQAIVDNAGTTKFESVDYEIHLCQTVDDTVSSPNYLDKVTEVRLQVNEFFELVVRVVKTEPDGIQNGTSKRGEQEKSVARAAKKTVSVRLSSSNEYPPVDTFNDKTNEKSSSVTDSDEEERRERKTEDRNLRAKENKYIFLVVATGNFHNIASSQWEKTTAHLATVAIALLLTA